MAMPEKNMCMAAAERQPEQPHSESFRRNPYSGINQFCNLVNTIKMLARKKERFASVMAPSTSIAVFLFAK
jgi:hypothetical protein